PLVPSVRMDPKPSAQIPPVYPLLQRQSNKLSPFIHNRHLSPGHGRPPKPIPCHNDVSVMSPNTCRGCLRAIHLSRPSTSLKGLAFEVVDARHKAGHDESVFAGWPYSSGAASIGS